MYPCKYYLSHIGVFLNSKGFFEHKPQNVNVLSFLNIYVLLQATYFGYTTILYTILMDMSMYNILFWIGNSHLLYATYYKYPPDKVSLLNELPIKRVQAIYRGDLS